MKKCLSIAILITTFIGLSGCSQPIDKHAPLKKDTIKTLDSSKIYHDFLPENGNVSPDTPEVIKPE